LGNCWAAAEAVKARAAARIGSFMGLRDLVEWRSKCRCFDCASRDETARGFAQDDTLFNG
jgi:hypothetical protein